MPQTTPFEPPTMTPLAPSVEKAYYRKCIQLKRRLNEIESANDEAKLRRLRLDRAIMKMRLERAFLLDELRKRMDQDVDGSDGSGEEGMATPPPDRPHRDKRRRPQISQPATSAAAPANSFQTSGYTRSTQRTTSDPNVGTPVVHGAGGRTTEDGQSSYLEPAAQGQTPVPSQPPALPHGSPYGPPPTGVPGANTTNGMDIDQANGREDRPASHEAGATSERVRAGTAAVRDNSEARVASTSREEPHTDGADTDR